jgi:hypothetical protein
MSAACRARSDASRDTVFSRLLYRLSSGATGRIVDADEDEDEDEDGASAEAGFSVGRK